MALPDCGYGTSCGSQIGANHKGICPSGWHIPSNAEWSTLVNYVGSSAGTKLKATSGWNSYSGVPAGTDSYGFAALPGGDGYSNGDFSSVGYDGYWWSATEDGATSAYRWYMDYGNEGVYYYDSYNIKKLLFSVRCLQDNSSVATYTVTYNAGTGVTVPANQTKTHDVALTLSGSVPTRAGYVFDSWNTSADGTGMSYASGASYTDNARVTLYAQWTANTYTVTYNANDGTGAPGNQTKTHDVALTLSAAVPTRTNYTFSSWNTSSNGTGTSYASGASYTADAGVTLYAQWSFTKCDGQTFRTVVIGTQTWMAENLNCDVSGSECYNNNESNCATYGRLYDWATAMALPSSCNSSTCSSQINAKHRGICPSGWHIPSNADWD
jgi:uncharacterized protein (TIGR02145 family)/uncharacterized repeat protein (TIGR02543 family)